MKRILFVDDDPLILQGLQRMLRDMRNHWSMVFAAGGREALELLATASFDVVVSDMRMPGMNGAELLNEVMKRYPQTVRLILSGHSDQELIMKCVGTTHQYLAKPCEPEALKAIVARATTVGNSLQNEKLKRLVGRLETVPSIPTLYVKVTEKLQNLETPLEAIADLIAQDMGMTAKILKLVNSAFFGLRHEIAAPQEAVTYLGLNTVKTLVLGIGAFNQFEGARLGPLSLDSLWQHSLQTAAAARKIARLEAVDRRIAEESLTAGMLHDVGRLVLAANFPELYAEALEKAKTDRLPLTQAETKIFGADHADVGGYLLGLWGLPVPVVEAIAFHHRPSAAGEGRFSPLALVHVANVLLWMQRPAFEEVLPPDLDENYLKSLGLENRLPAWMDSLNDPND